ncbi:MAG: PAS domain-containing protein [Beijerinckiaceae bacterium]
MRHDGSRALHAHWDSLRRPSGPPDRNDLEPALIGAYLQDVFILGADADGSWTYRVAGTRLTAFAGRELRDEPFTSWWRAGDREDTARIVLGVATEPTAIIGGVRGLTTNGRDSDFELLLLPLRHGGRPGLRMLGGLFPTRAVNVTAGARIEELQMLSLRTLRGPPIQREPRFTVTAAQPGEERRNLWRVIEGGRPSEPRTANLPA